MFFQDLCPRPYFFEIFCNPFSQTLFLRPFCTSWATTLVFHILTCPDRSCGLPMVGDLLTLSSSLNLTMSGGSKRSMGLAPAQYMAVEWLHPQHGNQQHQHHCQGGHQLQHICQHGPTTPDGQHIVHIIPREGHTTPREGHTSPPEGPIRDRSLIVMTISSRKCFIGWVINLDSELYNNIYRNTFYCLSSVKQFGQYRQCPQCKLWKQCITQCYIHIYLIYLPLSSLPFRLSVSRPVSSFP